MKAKTKFERFRDDKIIELSKIRGGKSTTDPDPGVTCIDPPGIEDITHQGGG